MRPATDSIFSHEFLLLLTIYCMVIAKLKHGDVHSQHRDDKLFTVCLPRRPHCVSMAPIVICFVFSI